MVVALACLFVFLVMAALMYTLRLSALLALPLMAIAISLSAGIPGHDITGQVLGAGSLTLANAYTTTMFGAVLAELINRQGIARAMIRWVAEFAGDNPFVLGAVMTCVVALLFSTLGGLGAVIMVGTIVLPVMLSLGIQTVTAGGLFLFGISLGGMFNLSNWQLYMDVLHIERSAIMSFVLPFAGVMAAIVLVYLAVELRRLKNFGYLAAALAVMGAGMVALSRFTGGAQAAAAASGADRTSLTVTGVSLAFMALFALRRHLRREVSTPAIAAATPFIPLLLVLAGRWEIIPAFLAGITFGVLATWQRNSVNTLTRAIIDGVATVIPAVVLMIGIGMLLAAVKHPKVAGALAPLLTQIVPTHALPYVLVFTALAPLSLYRGPLSLWGMGSGLVALVQKTTSLSSPAIMGMLMSVGQVQGVCDPTNTQNVWIATYLGTDTQQLLAKTLLYVWFGVFAGLSLAVFFGYVPW